MKLSTDEINLVRQWFNAVQDLNPKYMQKADYKLYLKVLDAYKQPINKGNATERYGEICDLDCEHVYRGKCSWRGLCGLRVR